MIHTKNKALKLYQRIRWQKGIICPKCGLIDNCKKHSKTKLGYQKYQCFCSHIFSDTSGTFLHRKRIGPRELFIAIYEISHHKGISSTELATRLGIKQKRAWTILDLLRQQCMKVIKPYYNQLMRGVVESDEAYFGKGSNATMVQGVVQRGKFAVIMPIKDRKESTLKGNLVNRVKKKSYIITDTAMAYAGLQCNEYRHYTLNHSKDEFSKGRGIHSNTIEGLWGNQKKIIYGIHHGVSKRKLFHYVSEYLLKYNLKSVKSNFTSFINLFLQPPLTC